MTGSQPMEPRKQVKLLCVDDEDEITDFLHDYFKEKGFEVYTAKSGELALELLRKNNPDIVLLDIRLSGGPLSNGLDILKEIKKYNAAIKVIMVTGIYNKTVIDQATALGASDYITKPLSLDYLDTSVMEKIQDVLSGSSDSEK
jgi:two-component system, response regulator, stage 0 sporulation protein F